MIAREELNGIIIAGGQSTRMGSDKGLMSFRGQALVSYSINILKAYCSDIIICTNNDEYHGFGYTLCGDNYPGIGPLGGLEAGLKKSSYMHHLVLPCDVPFINSIFLESLLTNVKNCNAVVPVHSNGMAEPLCAYYHSGVYKTIHNQIKNKDYKMQHFIRQVNACYLDMDKTSKRIDPAIFRNFNHPDDLIQQMG